MPEQQPSQEIFFPPLTRGELSKNQGKLKIFLGAVAGVGKTYAMLEAAQRQQVEGVDVVVGSSQKHCQPDTKALLAIVKKSISL